MAPENKIEAKNLGILVSGLVMGKNQRETDKGIKYSVDLAIPNQKEQITCDVTSERYMEAKSMEVFKNFMTFNLWKGRLYFRMAQ